MRLPAQSIVPFESRERSRIIKCVNIEAKIERFKDQNNNDQNRTLFAKLIL